MVDITPTLFIGLGGTGMEVLTGVRRLFFERYGRFEVPCLEYLYIDTDRRQSRSRFYPPDHISDAIGFRPGETVFARVTQEAVTDYFEHPDTYPHIFSWLSRGAFKFGPSAITEGAGQYRPFGRLALFHGYKDIRKAIAAKLNRIASEATIQGLNSDDPNFNIRDTDRAVKVFIVASIAGGTGAGMCLDLPYIVRDVARESSGELGLVSGFLVLPDVYVQAEDVFELTPDEKRKMQANGYAALKELEYYSRLGTVGDQRTRRFEDGNEKRAVFRAHWALDEPARDFDELPFDVCNVLGNANASGIDLNSVRDVVDMLAERIYLDFDEGGFTAQREQREANIKQSYSQNYPLTHKDDAGNVIYSNPFSCRFSSFAISKIYMDRMRLRHAASYELAQLVLGELSAGTGSADAYQDQQRAELTQLPLRLDALLSSLTERVQGQIAAEMARKTSAEFQTLQGDLRQTADPQSARDYKKIGASLTTFLAGQLDRFRDWLESLLCEGLEQLGIDPLLALLLEIRTEAEQDQQSGMDPPAAPDGPLGERIARLTEAEGLPGFPASLKRHATSQLLSACSDEAERYARSVIERLIKIHANRALYTPLIELLQLAADRLERTKAALVQLSEKSDDVAGAYGLAHHKAELLRFQQSPRNLLLTVDTELAEACRQALSAEGDDGILRSRMQDLKQSFRAALVAIDPHVRSFVAYGEPGHAVHFADLRNQLVRICYEALDGFYARRHAIDELTRCHGAEGARHKLEQRMHACRPFVQFDQNFVVNWMKDRMAPLTYCGFDAAAGGKEGLVMRAIREGEQKFQPLPSDRDAVLFLYIINGLPLCAIDQLKQFREAYQRLLEDPRTSTATFHLDKNSARFPDIVKQGREQALAEMSLMKAVLQGVILRLIDWNEPSGRFVLRYTDDSGVIRQDQTVDCGSGLGAILDTFNTRPELRGPLESARNQWVQQQQRDQAGVERLVHYWLALRYYQRNIFRRFPQACDDPELASTIPTTESLIVDGLITEVDQLLRSHPQYDAEGVERYANNWKYWLESFCAFVGPKHNRCLVLGESEATDTAALETLRYHHQRIIGRSDADPDRLCNMNPVDEQSQVPAAWVGHWAGRGVTLPESTGSRNGGSFNPYRSATVEPAAETVTSPEEEPDPFSAI